MDARSWPFFFPKARARTAMRNRLWFFRIIPAVGTERPRRSSLFFLLLSEVLCWMHLPIFFRLCHFPCVAFFHPGESGNFFFFFSVESTPENSRRHLVAELLITASLHASCPILRALSFSLSFFPRFAASNFGIRMYGSCNRRIPRARLLGTNETRPFAWCRLANGVATRRIASYRVGGSGVEGYRITSTWKRRCKTILRDSIKLLLSDRLSLPVAGGRDGGRGSDWV